MSADRYPAEVLSDDYDDGTMPDNVDELRQAVVGHRIISAHQGSRIIDGEVISGAKAIES